MPGGFNFQVSEFVKLVIILLVARFLTELKSDHLDWPGSFEVRRFDSSPDGPGDEAARFGNRAHLLADVPESGSSWPVSQWQSSGDSGGCAGVHHSHGGLALLLQDYQKARLISFLDPELDPRGDRDIR